MNDKYESNPFKYPTSTPKVQTNNDAETPRDEELKKMDKVIKIEDEEIPKLKGINVKLYPNLHKEYKKHCIEKGQTIQDHIVSLIKKELKKNK